MSDLILTPGNALKLADRLSHLRGAAMKLGQMISMDAGDMLPAELSMILSRLRDNAHHMPPAQLQTVLAKQWGADWRQRLRRFDAIPIAAASIGQVHRATTLDGEDLAIKVQYPGVAESIDADVDNVATLLRLSGVLPRNLDIAPLLAEAKRQLNEEADYRREGAQITRFGELLAGSGEFVLPTLYPALTTSRVLAMSFVEGAPVETLMAAPQATRDKVIKALINLVLREMFDFGIMQTDPNFANYRYQADTGRLVLLDFGAVRPITSQTAEAYRNLLTAGLSCDRDRMRDAAVATGFLGEAAAHRHRGGIDHMLDVIVTELNRSGPFDFGDRAFVGTLREEGAKIAADRETWHVPPVDTLFTQRKISGTALLAARVKARVDVRAMLQSRFSSGRDAVSAPALDA